MPQTILPAEPYTLTPGELARSSMVTGAAMANRLQRLEERGLLKRTTDTANRRSVLVRLTDDGLALVDEITRDLPPPPVDLQSA